MTRHGKRRLRKRLTGAALALGAALGLAATAGVIATGILVGLVTMIDARVDRAWQARMGAAVVVPLPPPEEERLGVDCPRCI